MARIFAFIFLTSIIFSVGCKDPFNPPVESTGQNFLVVEGVLNTANGPTTIRLSRSLRLQDTARIKPELNATLIVEGKDNTIRILTSQGNGLYGSPSLNLAINQEYRLRIRTSGGREYLSEYIVAKATPQIDSIGWKREEDGVQIYANTHDASNNSRYYRWEFEETWEIRSTYYSTYKYIGDGTVVPRAPNDNVSVCWKYHNSTTILLGSSAKLQSDVIYQAPLTFIENAEERLGVRYSILVRQYVLDKSGYDFFEMMKKMTESIGTVFDPQPSEIRGNFKAVADPNEVVVGYLTASSIVQKRIFITRGEVPQWGFMPYCPEITVANKKDTLEAYYGSLVYAPYAAVLNPNNQIVGYASSFPSCVDCTTRGGSVTKPSYW